MIAACPKCQAKYRVDTEQLGAGEARLRCAKCQAVFRVRAPQEPAARPAPAAPVTPVAPTQAPAPQQMAPPESPPESPSEAPVDRERLVLIADSDVESGKATLSAVTGLGLQPVLVHDGVEALLTIQRMLPRAVILDAALPKMFGFQICEMVKRNESLRPIQVALVGSVHHPERYRRPPSELYGADVYLEKPELLESLASVLSRFGFDVAGAPAAAPQPVAAPPQPVAAPRVQTPAAPEPIVSPPAPQPVAPAPAPPPQAPAADDGLAADRANAERLARIIVSDIVLYQPDVFGQGLEESQLVKALDGALQEGRGFFAQRIDERVRAEKDYLMEELLRVARERGSQ